MWYTVGAILMFGVIGFMIGYPIITAEKPQVQTVEMKQPEKIQYESKKVEIKEVKTIKSNKPTRIETTQTIQQQILNADQIEAEIHQIINAQRIGYGVKPLGYDTMVALVAKKHSQDMVDRNFIAHVNPDGKDPHQRLKENGLRCTGGGGENIYYVTNDDTNIAQKTVDRWLSSPGHRENILDQYFKTEGIGVVISGNRILITQNFC